MGGTGLRGVEGSMVEWGLSDLRADWWGSEVLTGPWKVENLSRPDHNHAAGPTPPADLFSPHSQFV